MPVDSRGGWWRHETMWAMRAAALVLYVAGVFGPCLASCFAAASGADAHACCPRRAPTEVPGVATAAAEMGDCCAITGHVRTAGFDTIAIPAAHVTMRTRFPQQVAPVLKPAVPVLSTASPPLRI